MPSASLFDHHSAAAILDVNGSAIDVFAGNWNDPEAHGEVCWFFVETCSDCAGSPPACGACLRPDGRQ